MPKSKKRPKAVAKARAATRRQQQPAPAAGEDLGLVQSPWATWLRIKEKTEVEMRSEALTFLEHYPFRIGDRACTSLADMANETGQSVDEVVEAQIFLESGGFLVWDRGAQSAVPMIPAR